MWKSLEEKLLVHNYVDAGHFFTDFNSPDYNPAASELAWKRTMDLLSQL